MPRESWVNQYRSSLQDSAQKLCWVSAPCRRLPSTAVDCCWLLLIAVDMAVFKMVGPIDPRNFGCSSFSLSMKESAWWQPLRSFWQRFTSGSEHPLVEAGGDEMADGNSHQTWMITSDKCFLNLFIWGSGIQNHFLGDFEKRSNAGCDVVRNGNSGSKDPCAKQRCEIHSHTISYYAILGVVSILRICCQLLQQIARTDAHHVASMESLTGSTSDAIPIMLIWNLSKAWKTDDSRIFLDVSSMSHLSLYLSFCNCIYIYIHPLFHIYLSISLFAIVYIYIYTRTHTLCIISIYLSINLSIHLYQSISTCLRITHASIYLSVSL